jgi:hypothetical protein
MMAPATIQGPRASRRAEPLGAARPGVATGVPQRWQNRARAESSAWQLAQFRGPAAAPQLEQNRPLTGAPQLAQVVAWGAVMSGET